MSEEPNDNERVDAVIVGAGAAGSIFAARLAQAGKQVVVLEMGPPWQLSDMISSQMWARRLKWGGAPIGLSGKHPVQYTVNNGWGFGGAALHHYGTWPRPMEEAFVMRSEHGRGLNWPFEYDELRPHYDRVQSDVGISGDAEAEIWRPPGDPYPMPPLKSFRHGEILRDGFESLDLQVAPLPLIINSVPYRGRAPCIYDGWCDAGCPIGALANPLVTYLKDAVAAGADVRPHAQVTRVLTDANGWADGVQFVTNGERGTLHADLVVLAATTLQNPRLLLNSAGGKHPNGVGNSGGQVGKYLTGDSMVFVYAMFDEDTENHMGVNAGQFLHREGLRHESRPDIFGGVQWQIGPCMKPNDIFGIAVTRADLFGNDLHAFVRKATKNMAYMVGFGCGAPSAENHVRLSDQRDEHGMPLAHVHHSVSQDNEQLREYLRAQGTKVMKAAGATEIWYAPYGAGGHLTGGTIMGTDPSNSVADGWGRLHDAPNVVIGGSGLFPTTGGASPTYSIHAMADRSAAFLLDNWAATIRPAA